MMKSKIPLKLLLLAALIGLIVGCAVLLGNLQSASSKESNICIDGIQYLPHTDGKEIAYTRQGKIKTCH